MDQSQKEPQMKNKAPLLLIACICLSLFTGCGKNEIPRSSVRKNGNRRITVDNNSMLQTQWFDISSEWEYYEGQYIPATQFYSYGIVADEYLPRVKKIVSIPHTWKKRKDVATYHICITGLIPEKEYASFMYDRFCTAGDMYVNGKCVYRAGFCSDKYEVTIPGRNMDIAYMTADRNGILDITMHCSNRIYRVAGVYFDVKIAESSYAEKWFATFFIFRIIFIGALFVIAIYQITLFILNKKKNLYLYLALFAICASIRLLFANFSIITVFFPKLPYSVSLRFDLFPIYSCSLFYLLYMISYSGHREDNPVSIAMITVASIFFCTNFFLPVSLTNYMVPYYQIYLFTSATIGLCFMFSKNQEGIRKINVLDILGFLVIVFAVYNDIGDQKNMPVLFPDTELLMYSFSVFVILQSLNTALIQYRSSEKIRHMSKEIQVSNIAAYRFVPNRVIKLLGKQSITEIKPKDYTKRDIILMNIDIRNFTTIAEGLGGKRVFDMLNIYMGYIAPIVRTYGGFVEKVMGDGMFCVFTEDAPKIVDCALEIRDSMTLLNSYLNKEQYPVIDIGIGIHKGNAVLGMLGTENRLNEIIVSPVVSEVMSIQNYEKVCFKPILFSEEFVESLPVLKNHEFIEIEQKKETPCIGYTGRLFTLA